MTNMEHGPKRSDGLEPRYSQKLLTRAIKFCLSSPVEDAANMFTRNANNRLLIQEKETTGKKHSRTKHRRGAPAEGRRAVHRRRRCRSSAFAPGLARLPGLGRVADAHPPAWAAGVPGLGTRPWGAHAPHYFPHAQRAMAAGGMKAT